MRSINTTLSAALAGALTLCAASAASEQAQPRESEMEISGQTLPMESVRDARFRFLDLNGDGYLTREEIGGEDDVLSSQFASLDANDDERLSEAEYVLFGRPE